MESSFKIGDLVWAKMKGFPPWPGLVSDPPKGLDEIGTHKENVSFHCVFFFGTKNYGFIEEKKLKPYHLYKDKLCAASKSMKFKQACKEIEQHTCSLQSEIEEHRVEKVLVLDSTERQNLETSTKKNDSSTMKRKPDASKKNSKKRKLSHTLDPDTTTPLDTLCPSPFDNASQYSKEDRSYHSPDEHSEEDNESIKEGNEEAADAPVHDSGPLKLGFIGLGKMGSGIVRNLVQTGHNLTVWNRSSEKATDFQSIGVKVVASPGEVVTNSQIIFCCVADAAAAKDVMFQNEGVIFYLNSEKSYVDISSIDVESSLDLSEAVNAKGSRYMEVRLQGSKKEADEGSLVCLAAGDESLYDDCSSFFQACSKKSYFMGEAGNASKIHLIIQSIAGVALAGLAESLALADRAGLDQSEVLKILELSQMNCPLIIEKARSMIKGNYATNMALKHMQNDLKNSISMGDSKELPTPLTATANEVFKHAKKVGYGGHDVSAIYLGTRF